MDRVIADRSTVYSQADLSSQAVGQVQHGAILIVTRPEQVDGQGREWTQTNLGFVPSNEVAETPRYSVRRRDGLCRIATAWLTISFALERTSASVLWLMGCATQDTG